MITDRFRLLGFGVEVTVAAPTLSAVHIALDASGKRWVAEPVTSFGTRHRSAFRFCSSYEAAAALIVSQDGGVKAVRQVGPRLLMWPDINFGALGL